LAYCDDVHIVGPPELAIPAYRRWAQLYSQALQGELRDEKGKVYAPNVPEHVLNDLGLPTSAPGSTTQPGEMPYTQAGLRILGAPVGSPEFCLKFSEELVDAVSAELGILGRMPSLQSQHTIATKSSVHRITHLLRTIPGGELDMYGPLAAAYDAAVLAVPARICRRVSLPQTAARIAQQPLGSGGLGYRTWKSTADTAFLAAYVHASIQIPALFPQLGHMFPDVRTFIRTAPGQSGLTNPSSTFLRVPLCSPCSSPPYRRNARCPRSAGTRQRPNPTPTPTSHWPPCRRHHKSADRPRTVPGRQPIPSTPQSCPPLEPRRRVHPRCHSRRPDYHQQ
jgi:hypothetical protein